MARERERMLAGELYDPMDGELVALRGRARDLCQALNATHEVEGELRRALARELFGSGGESVGVQPPFFCDYGANISLGERVFINFNCVILDVCAVRIGDYTLLGPSVQIYTATHPLDAQLRRTRELGKPVTIGRDVWIGGGAIVLPGVTIGDRAVIGAGSVVTRDVPSGVVAVGNPCGVVKELRGLTCISLPVEYSKVETVPASHRAQCSPSRTCGHLQADRYRRPQLDRGPCSSDSGPAGPQQSPHAASVAAVG